MGLYYILPGSPWCNGYVESFNSRLREECLNINSFYSLLHARVVIGDWKTQYNHHRRHSSLGYLPPSSTLGFAPIKRKPATPTTTGPNNGGGPPSPPLDRRPCKTAIVTNSRPIRAPATPALARKNRSWTAPRSGRFEHAAEHGPRQLIDPADRNGFAKPQADAPNRARWPIDNRGLRLILCAMD